MKFENSMFVALIPARGGSKGVLRKNLYRIHNKPLVDYTIEAAKESKYIDYVFLSSDDAEILSRGSSLGINLINRPAEYAKDDSSAVDVVLHFLAVTPNLIDADPYLVYLQPTSPCRSSIHIDQAINLMLKKNSNKLMSVTESDKSPFKMFLIDDKSNLQSLFDQELSNCRRQDLPKSYIVNGAIYIFKPSEFIKISGFPSNGSVPYIMSKDDSLDIDTLDDIQQVNLRIREG